MTIEMNTKNPYKLEKTYPVSMADVDMNYSIKPSSLLNFMQDTASENINSSSFGNKQLNSEGLGWFLVRYRIEFDKYPENIDKITIKTENRGVSGKSAYRDFEAFTTNGERLFRASTYWLMADIESKTLVNIEQKFPNVIKYEKREDDLTLRKLKPLPYSDREKTFHVRYNDIDMNGHVNNIVYIMWAIEALDLEFIKNHTICAIDIYFKHDISYGEDIISYAKIDETSSQHSIKNLRTGEELCLINITYE